MSIVMGMDEVGRGALAGAVVAAAVCFDVPFVIRDPRLPVRIDDSKRLSAKQREASARWIYENAISWGIGEGSVGRINKKGIVPAAHFAFRKSFRVVRNAIDNDIDIVLIDAFYIPRLGVSRAQQRPIIKGDQKEFCIAAASIIAKVYRDELMEVLGNKKTHHQYLWQKNKGYGTKEHIAAIKKFGTTKQHRTLFVRNLL